MEAFQILAGHGDMARAHLFARSYVAAQIACYGYDANDIDKWMEMVKVKNPMAYVEEIFTAQWLRVRLGKKQASGARRSRFLFGARKNPHKSHPSNPKVKRL